ncbi:MAG TPA: hypothetical protein VNA69_10195 [Thermoanaerobaculia bacterium]|nr:hypothetical protein [Thermoanaerobaculia bacterium]
MSTGFWDGFPSKMAGLRQLVASGLSVPQTVEVAGPDSLKALSETLAAADDAAIAEWVVRVDAPPHKRFSISGGMAPAAGVPDLLRVHWARWQDSGYGLLVQRKLVRACDGIALRTATGHIVIEVQDDRPGNFFRDGSTPRRWILRDGACLGVEVLSQHALGQLLAALAALPVASCIEWVLTPDDRLHFVDLKPLPQDYLADADPFAGAVCQPLRCGEVTGTAYASAPAGQGQPCIHIGRSTHVDLLPELGPCSRAVVFTGGGLLSHAAVYAALCTIPVLICTPGHLPQLSPGAVGTLVIGSAGHHFEEAP